MKGMWEGGGLRFRARFPAQLTERDKDMGVGSSRCGNPLNLEMISVCECPLPNPGAAPAFHPQCQARRHTQVLWHWPHARPQGPDSPGGNVGGEGADAYPWPAPPPQIWPPASSWVLRVLCRWPPCPCCNAAGQDGAEVVVSPTLGCGEPLHPVPFLRGGLDGEGMR